MSRFSAADALVLRLRPSGESNREAFFLTAEAGVTRAFVYGGPKSKLRSYVSPFHTGRLFLYHDPVRDSYKVTDFDVQKWRAGIRESYERMMAAAAIAETALASDGGGCSWGEALALINTSLDALDGASDGAAERILIHYLWNWADLLGIREEEQLAALSAAARRWLEVVSPLPASELKRYGLDGAPLKEAKNFCTGLLSGYFGRMLKSWEQNTP
jgi:DNA repair protein RecO (recombination protein O)